MKTCAAPVHRLAVIAWLGIGHEMSTAATALRLSSTTRPQNWPGQTALGALS